jgi:hypothetical protein
VTEHEALALAFVAMSDTLTYLNRHTLLTRQERKDAIEKLEKALLAAGSHFTGLPTVDLPTRIA